MITKKDKKIAALDLELRNKDLENKKLKIENKNLKLENEKLIEYFVENYDYVLTIKNGYCHLFQDGKEIKRIQSININADISSISFPSIEVEVR